MISEPSSPNNIIVKKIVGLPPGEINILDESIFML